MAAINSAKDVYEYVEFLKKVSKENKANDICTRLDDAMSLGSSAMEMLGAVKNVLIEDRDRLAQMLNHDYVTRMKEVITFVDKAYGRD